MQLRPTGASVPSQRATFVTSFTGLYGAYSARVLLPLQLNKSKTTDPEFL